MRCLLTLFMVMTLSSCGYLAARDLQGEETTPPDDFFFLGDRTACYLKLPTYDEALRMNCFQLNGRLHIHSSRWAILAQFGGKSWRDEIRKTPNVKVEIDGKIFAMTATAIDDEARRQEILADRGYVYPWKGITVFQFLPTYAPSTTP